MNVAELAPAGLACVRLLPFAIWLARASAGYLPGAVAWSSALALALFFASGAAPLTLGEGELLRHALRELGVGAVTCFVLAAPFAALRFALAGLGRAVLGPLGERVPTLFGLGACALLMELALPRALVRALADGFTIVPIGQAAVRMSELPWALSAVFGHASALCVTLLVPWLGALLALDAGLALTARLVGAGQGESTATLPLRVSLVALGLGGAWFAFAERLPLLVRGGFSLLRGVLERVQP